MARRRKNTTKYEIAQLATSLFLEVGYAATTPKRICDELDISTGNLTYYFPTKEHLLEILVKLLCAFQQKTVENNIEEGNTSLLAICMELATMASMCEENRIARELFISMYSSPLCLEVIRKNDKERSKIVYADYCQDWTDEHFTEAEILVSGIEYATMMTTGDSASLEIRISGAINNVMQIYGVPKEIRDVKIQKVLKMDYRALGLHILDDFKNFVNEANDQMIENFLA